MRLGDCKPANPKSAYVNPTETNNDAKQMIGHSLPYCW